MFCCLFHASASGGSYVRPLGCRFDVTSNNGVVAGVGATHAKRVSTNIHDGISIRGGRRNRRKKVEEVKSDSNVVVAAKTAVSVALEAAGLLGAIKLAEIATPKVNELLGKNVDLAGLPILQWLSLVFIIFSSSTIKSWISGSVGAATKQVLRPDVVPGDASWYSNLKKPWFNPPGWVFPIMWLIVSKPTQLIAVSKILKSSSAATTTPTTTPYWPALAVYCTHLALGDAWNDVFFGYQRIGLGAIVISIFFGFLLGSAKLFGDIDPAAGKLMLPTCGWVFIATSLNLAIYAKNKK